MEGGAKSDHRKGPIQSIELTGAPITTDYLRKAFAQDPQGKILHYWLDSFDRQSARDMTGRTTDASFPAPYLADPAMTASMEKERGFRATVGSAVGNMSTPSNLVGIAATDGAESALGVPVGRTLGVAYAAQSVPRVVQQVQDKDYGGAVGTALLAGGSELAHHVAGRVAPPAADPFFDPSVPRSAQWLATRERLRVATQAAMEARQAKDAAAAASAAAAEQRARVAKQAGQPWRVLLGLDENGDSLRDREGETGGLEGAANAPTLRSPDGDGMTVTAQPVERGDRFNYLMNLYKFNNWNREPPLDYIEKVIRNERNGEYVIAFDPAGKKILFALYGKGTDINIPKEFTGQLKGTIFTHNHPTGWRSAEGTVQRNGESFSSSDIKTACKYGVSEVRAVTPGYTYSMKPPPNGWSETFWKEKVYPEVVKAEGQLYTQEAWQAIDNRSLAGLAHEVWKTVAKNTGMDYKRKSEVK